jgi:hypothetical protein
MAATLMIDLLALAAAAVSPVQDCRAISNAADRLACYDARDAAPRPPAAKPVPAAPTTAEPLPPPAPSASSAAIVRADPSGRIVSVKRLRYGLSRLTLDDGRVFDTATNTDAPPAVGTSVRLRRSVLGTTFLDSPGRSPLTVRLVRQYR